MMKKFPKIYALLSSVAFIIVFIVFLFAGSQLVLFFKEPLPKLYYGIFGCLGALLTYYIFSKIEHKPFQIKGLIFGNKPLSNTLIGIFIGIGIFMLMMLAFNVFGGMYLQKIDTVSYGKTALSLIPFIPLALMEELAFRTYPFLNLKSNLGIWPSQFIIALLFALYHILMGWPIFIAFMGPFIWSFAFGWATLYTKGIAMSFGFHLALNWMQNLVSMKNESNGIFRLVVKNNASKQLIATNENLGIGMHIVVLLIACFLTYRYYKTNKPNLSN